MSRQAAQATPDRCPDGKRTPVQRFDAMGNERQAHNCFDGPNQQSKKEVGSVILYKEERKCRDREIKDGGGTQKNATVGAIQTNSQAQQFADS